MYYVQIPGPITLSDSKTGKALKIGKLVDGEMKAVEAEPMTLHDFVLEHILPMCKGSKEYRQADTLIGKLADAETARAANPIVDPWIELDDPYVTLFKEKMNHSEMNGILGRQFLPFINAFEDAKRERPKAELKSVEAATATPLPPAS